MKKSKYSIYILLLLLTGCDGCKEDCPLLTTSDIGEITTNLTTMSARSGGNITNDGGDAIIERGVCWNTSPNPTITNNKTSDGTGTGNYTSTLTGLSYGETYYVRAYATSSVCTEYGNERSYKVKGWAKYSGNPVMNPGSSSSWDKETIGLGSVIYYNNKYHMWYSGGSTIAGTLNPWKIGHATSDDGIAWTKDINNPVLVPGTSGSWDSHVVFLPQVVVINNTFHMWYTGHKGTSDYSKFQIGHATSPNGTAWTKDANNPVLTTGSAGTWDKSWINCGSVLYAGTKYHMWYSGCDSSGIGIKVGHATSTDGQTWTKDPANPVLVSLAPGKWDYPRVDFPYVMFDGAVYHMWYSGGSIPFQWKVGHATSTDGLNWTKDPLNPVLSPGQSETWDSYSVGVMSVMSSGVKYKMWYSGCKLGVSTCIGYAEKPVE